MSKKAQDNPVTQQESSEEESSAGKDSSQSQESNKSLPSSSASGQSGGFSQPPKGQGSHIQNIWRGFTVQDILTPPKTAQSSETQSSSTSEQLPPAEPSGSRKRSHKEATAHVEGTPAKTAKEKTYKCEHCTNSIVSYQTKKELDRHLKSIHSLIRCRSCDFLAKSSGELNTHNAKQHPTPAAAPAEKDTAHVEGTPAKTAKEGSFKCEHCTGSPSTYQTKKDLDRHLKSVHSLWRCKSCDFFAKSSKELKTHNAEQHRPPAAASSKSALLDWGCPHCPARFPTALESLKHKKTHYEHNCGKCSTCYKTEKQLANHNQLFHSGEENITFECQHCGDQFQSRKDFEIHADNVVKRKKSLKCPVCGKESKKNHLLKLHYYSLGDSHLDKLVRRKRYGNKCKKCNRKFKTERHLKKHCKYFCREKGHSCL